MYLPIKAIIGNYFYVHRGLSSTKKFTLIYLIEINGVICHCYVSLRFISYMFETISVNLWNVYDKNCVSLPDKTLYIAEFFPRISPVS